MSWRSQFYSILLQIFEYSDPDPNDWLEHKTALEGTIKLNRAEILVSFKLLIGLRPGHVRRNYLRGLSTRKMFRCPACLNLLFCSKLVGVFWGKWTYHEESAQWKLPSDHAWVLQLLRWCNDHSRMLSDHWVTDGKLDRKPFSDPSIEHAEDFQTCPFLWSAIQMIFNPMSKSEDNGFCWRKTLFFHLWMKWERKEGAMIFKSNKLWVQRKLLSSLWVSVNYTVNFHLQKTYYLFHCVAISRGSYKALLYMVFTLSFLGFSLEDWFISDTSRKINSYR